MKRFTLILSLMVAMVTTAMAGDIVVSTNEASPENVFTMKNGNGNGVGGDTAPGNGKFAFFAADVENAYYIYSVTEGKWVDYTLAGSYDNQKNFVTLSDTKGNYFNIQHCASNADYYEIRPYNTTGVAGKYLNYFQGAADGVKLGLWQQDGDTDAGSRYLIEEYEEVVTVNTLEGFNQNKCYTITTSSRGAWSVTNDLTKFQTTTYAGQTVDKTNTKQHFAVLSADGENYYLFNVAANKFVKQNRDLVAGVADAIVLHDASTLGEGRVMIQFKGMSDGYVNIGGNGDPAINTWGATAGQLDAGNAVLFTEVGDFNPTEALAMLSNVATVTYKFMYNGNVVATQQEVVNKGGAYPAFNVPNVPLGIVPAEGVPTGNVSGDIEKEITLTVNDELIPFEYIAEGTPTVWYYARMHGNPNVTSYVEDNGSGVIEWSDKNIEVSEIDSHLWGFVGDAFNGFKMVNKETGNAIASTGSGNASMAEVTSATAFHAMASDNSTQGAFCLKYKDNNNYLNAQDGIIKHWDDNDNGSTFFLTEDSDEEVATVEVSAANYATLFLGEPVYIPAGVEAYVVSGAADGSADMEQVTGILPANTGVILKNTGNYTFTLAPARISGVGTNLLAGTTEDAVITKDSGKEYYILANGENGVGLYKPTIGEDATQFNNAANKAYLVVPAAQAEGIASYSFRFGEGTTGIENVTTENVNVTGIYDLTGRRVEAITAPGIYVVNGKKVLVK